MYDTYLYPGRRDGRFNVRLLFCTQEGVTEGSMCDSYLYPERCEGRFYENENSVTIKHYHSYHSYK